MMFKSRRPVYFSKTKDEDLINYTRQFENKYPFTHIVKELMRDGIKYRKLQKSGRLVEEYIQPVQNEEYYKVTQSNTPKNKPNFSDIKLEKKEMSDEELEDKLSDF